MPRYASNQEHCQFPVTSGGKAIRHPIAFNKFWIIWLIFCQSYTECCIWIHKKVLPYHSLHQLINILTWLQSPQHVASSNMVHICTYLSKCILSLKQKKQFLLKVNPFYILSPDTRNKDQQIPLLVSKQVFPDLKYGTASHHNFPSLVSHDVGLFWSAKDLWQTRHQVQVFAHLQCPGNRRNATKQYF